eukprot:CAMPEP_0194349790 /NCGR_PEP_ID=MMETSP0171-20130528/107286_1 /TAXON_ID=218684 /ORGANISM="Corethron pennatum, Strain L29A3" /LENGTH=382 /DNA_ID=CAMNT_0039117283 /DNA_START=72 /DNA_END=1220 /DNA_ORIENTATION=-
MPPTASQQCRPGPSHPRNAVGPYDDLLSLFTQKCASDAARNSQPPLPSLLREFFSFLQRRTDLYYVRDEGGEGHRMGFPLGDAEKIVLASFREFPLRRVPCSPSRTGTAPGTGARPEGRAEGAQGAAPAPAPDARPSHAAGGKKIDDKGGASGPAAPPTGKKNMTGASGERGLSDVRYTEEGLQVPVGNGGVTSAYYWTQTLDEVTVVIEESGDSRAGDVLPCNVRGKELDVRIKATTGSVRLKGAEEGNIIIEGKWGGKVRPGDSSWSIESRDGAKGGGRCLILSLDKADPVWWSEALLGDDVKIDTELVDSTRKISTYDEQTQGELRRMLFDQRAERLGLPSSAEILGKSGAGIKGGKNVILPDGVEVIDPLNIPNKTES